MAGPVDNAVGTSGWCSYELQGQTSTSRPTPNNAARGFAGSMRKILVSSSIRFPPDFWTESAVRPRELSGLSHRLSVLVHNRVVDHSTGEAV